MQMTTFDAKIVKIVYLAITNVSVTKT